MKEFKNKVALITGAGNGFGFEIAKECAERQMKLVLADIDENDLKAAVSFLKEKGAEVTGVHCDVTLDAEVQKMVDIALDTYGSIDFLVNNAGVAISGPVWKLPLQDWDWIIGANLMSQVYAMRRVIPIMLKQKTECHILNVASVAGLITSNGMPAYHTTKHASVALTESTSYDLQAIGANIRMSVFCPGFVQTDLHNYERHRPERFMDKSDPYYSSPDYYSGQKKAEFVIRTGMPIDSIGMSVLNGIEEDQFYILTHPIYSTLIGRRVKDMLEGRGPDLSVLRG
ncbi:MAG: SDR family NAD(P)-dependent oxidoreductase [Clostridia bacterium]|nr:SDR family NAD(P)-dependent oxidoreductase [Clostridia bacterium]